MYVIKSLWPSVLSSLLIYLLSSLTETNELYS